MSYKDERNEALSFFNEDIKGKISPYKMIIDEVIWGHRFLDDESPSLMFLEFLNVLKHFYRKTDNQTASLFVKGKTIDYSVNLSKYLRELLFNNPCLDLIYQNKNISKENKWKEWKENFSMTSNFFKGNKLDDFIEKCKDVKGLDFNQFCELIFLLRQMSFEGGSNKRWTSKFVFPFGEQALYFDCGLKKKGKEADDGGYLSVDRRFFGRAGELLYLMLANSKKSDDLSILLKKQFFDQKNIFNNLVDFFENASNEQLEDNSRTISGCYLPQPQPNDNISILFDNLTADWISILKLKMPLNDKFFHLIQISGMYIIRYFLVKSGEFLHEFTNENINIDMITEVVSVKKSKVRSLAAERYLQNDLLSADVVEQYVKKTFDEVAQKSGFNDYINNNLKLSKDLSNSIKLTTKEEAQNIILDSALKRHKQHLSKIHSAYGKSIGLVSSIKSNRNRYILSDQLVKSLVFTNVKKRMQFDEFLQCLYVRYGIIVGRQQAEKYVKEHRCENEVFENNVLELENRLFSLGLLYRLSDLYSYVINPFSKNN